jgi:hypothetical protein
VVDQQRAMRSGRGLAMVGIFRVCGQKRPRIDGRSTALKNILPCLSQQGFPTAFNNEGKCFLPLVSQAAFLAALTIGGVLSAVGGEPTPENIFCFDRQFRSVPRPIFVGPSFRASENVLNDPETSCDAPERKMCFESVEKYFPMKIVLRSSVILGRRRGPYYMSQYLNFRTARVAENLPPFGNELQRPETSVPGAKKYFQLPVIAGCSQHLPIEGADFDRGPKDPFRRWSVERTIHRETHRNFMGRETVTTGRSRGL